jgi:hypothetical protein
VIGERIGNQYFRPIFPQTDRDFQGIATMTLWGIRSGKYGERETFALENNLAVVGWDELPGYTPSELSTSAAVSLEPDGAGFKITRSALTLVADVPGLDAATFDKLAEAAEKTCPVSRVLNAEITLEKTLK